jgi:thiol-disulfide isomerase/thioredoxin
MKYFKTFLIAALSFFADNGFSQTGQVKLSGKIDTAITNQFRSRNLSIKFNQTTNNFNMSKMVEVPLKPDGTFAAVLPCDNYGMYLSFWLTDNRPSDRSGSIALKGLNGGEETQEKVYLFEAGDSISMHMNKSRSLSFKGRGSNKLNCQTQIYSIDFNPVGMFVRKAELLTAGDLMAPLDLQLRIRTLAKDMKLEILSSYKNELSRDIYNRIYLDVMAAYQIPMHAGLFWYGYKKPVEPSIKIAQQFFEHLCQIPDPSTIDSSLYAGSAYYPELLFLKELNSLRLYSLKGKYENGDSFESIYRRLKSRYTGKLRDKLLLICFERLTRKFSTEARNLVKDALNTMEDTDSRQILEDWAKKQEMAYAFELRDEHGKIHRLADYTGKVLVIDFWFTGCGACAELTAAMHPIIEKYKSNKNVVFMTVNTDQYKSQWLKSIQTGKYTSAETINLYTDGLRDQHPIIQYYNYVGAPQLLIIGSRGNMISSHAPRPDYALDRRKWPRNRAGLLEPRPEEILSNPYAQDFMKLIDDALKR